MKTCDTLTKKLSQMEDFFKAINRCAEINDKMMLKFIRSTSAFDIKVLPAEAIVHTASVFFFFLLIIGFNDVFYRQENASFAGKIEIKLKPRSIIVIQNQGRRKIIRFRSDLLINGSKTYNTV